MKKYLSLVNNELVIPFQVGVQAISFRHPIQTFIKIYAHFASDSLYRNSIYLMVSTAVMAFFGFFFWMINARLYTPEQVGIATTLISVMGLIAGFSNLGLNVGLVRFLPSSKNKNELINSSFLISSVTALILSVIFLLGLHIFSPKLLFLRENLIYAASFVLFVVALSNNTIVEALFVAYRSAKYTLVKNSVMSITKLFLPLALIVFGAYGIFAAVGLANIIAIILSVFILIKLFNFRIAYKHNLDEVKRIASYSFGNYVAGFFGSLPVMVLPLIIVNKLGAAEAGYFYIAMMIANLLFITPRELIGFEMEEAVKKED
ncbi:oligosaccharide flippase family protein [Patescibacteria group bacterium]|nr:oligosaccharide flippase family protein [Patescibacteria group bacterium]